MIYALTGGGDEQAFKKLDQRFMKLLAKEILKALAKQWKNKFKLLVDKLAFLIAEENMFDKKNLDFSQVSLGESCKTFNLDTDCGMGKTKGFDKKKAKTEAFNKMRAIFGKPLKAVIEDIRAEAKRTISPYAVNTDKSKKLTNSCLPPIHELRTKIGSRISDPKNFQIINSIKEVLLNEEVTDLKSIQEKTKSKLDPMQFSNLAYFFENSPKFQLLLKNKKQLKEFLDKNNTALTKWYDLKNTPDFKKNKNNMIYHANAMHKTFGDLLYNKKLNKNMLKDISARCQHMTKTLIDGLICAGKEGNPIPHPNFERFQNTVRPRFKKNQLQLNKDITVTGYYCSAVQVPQNQKVPLASLLNPEKRLVDTKQAERSLVGGRKLYSNEHNLWFAETLCECNKTGCKIKLARNIYMERECELKKNRNKPECNVLIPIIYGETAFMQDERKSILKYICYDLDGQELRFPEGVESCDDEDDVGGGEETGTGGKRISQNLLSKVLSPGMQLMGKMFGSSNDSSDIQHLEPKRNTQGTIIVDSQGNYSFPIDPMATSRIAENQTLKTLATNSTTTADGINNNAFNPNIPMAIKNPGEQPQPPFGQGFPSGGDLPRYPKGPLAITPKTTTDNFWGGKSQQLEEVLKQMDRNQAGMINNFTELKEKMAASNKAPTKSESAALAELKKQIKEQNTRLAILEHENNLMKAAQKSKKDAAKSDKDPQSLAEVGAKATRAPALASGNNSSQAAASNPRNIPAPKSLNWTPTYALSNPAKPTNPYDQERARRIKEGFRPENLRVYNAQETEKLLRNKNFAGGTVYLENKGGSPVQVLITRNADGSLSQKRVKPDLQLFKFSDTNVSQVSEFLYNDREDNQHVMEVLAIIKSKGLLAPEIKSNIVVSESANENILHIKITGASTGPRYFYATQELGKVIIFTGYQFSDRKDEMYREAQYMYEELHPSSYRVTETDPELYKAPTP